MASRKENIKSLFSNTRTRVIIIFTVVLLVVAVGIGYVKIRSSLDGSSASADVGVAPGDIQSIPGALDQTAEYAKLQEEQNLNQAKTALETSGSAIPTIIRTQALGEGVGVVGSQSGQNGKGFTALSLQDEAGAQRSLWIQTLQNGSCSKSVVQQVMNQGAQLSDLKGGCTCVQLKDSGYPLKDLESVCECKELKAAGYNARELKDLGYTAGRLRDCGFDACELRNAGFTAQEMKDGGFSDGELKGAGFSDNEISKTSGLPDGLSAADVRNSGCGADALAKLRNAGVSASAIRKITGCSAEQLKAAGYSAKDLKDAGFSAADLRNAGFSAENLKDAGYGARDLLNAGYPLEELAKAGYTKAQINRAQAELPFAITTEDIKNAGCDPEKLKKLFVAGVTAKQIKDLNGCSADALTAAGFNEKSLLDAGFTAQQIKSAGASIADCSVESLKKAKASGVSAATIKKTLGCSAKALMDAGYSAKELKDAGFTAAELKNAGFSAKDLKDAGFSPKELQEAGFTANELKNAGFTAEQLKAAGFSADQLKAAGFSAEQLKAAGFSAEQLKAAGFSADQLKAAGFSAEQLKAAGFSAPQLKSSGFNAEQLKAAGFTEAELRKAGFGLGVSQVEGLQNPIIQQQGSNVAGIPSFPGAEQPTSLQAQQNAASSRQLQAILAKQNQVMAEQKYEQKIQQRTSDMIAAATQSLQNWKKVDAQVYIAGSEETKKEELIAQGEVAVNSQQQILAGGAAMPAKAIIKTGDILFAVMDTSVNSDEPGPILATIVSGKLNGTKLIGSFNLPSNSEKMVITFNMMSVPGAAKTISISAYAIDPNTARTALSSRTNHHYMMRYGSLFASSFLQGFGNAFQSANTTVTIGGTGGGNNITVQNGIGRSTLQNAVIGLATVGKSWGQQAQQIFNTPTTVEVYSGTGLGILFTQDVTII